MKPGRELDALVAEKVMGFVKNKEENTWKQHKIGEGTFEGPVPNYSTAIAYAWEVVEKLSDMGFVISVSIGKNYYQGMYPAWVQWKRSSDNVHECTGGQFAPHAICLAALQVVGVEV